MNSFSSEDTAHYSSRILGLMLGMLCQFEGKMLPPSFVPSVWPSGKKRKIVIQVVKFTLLETPDAKALLKPWAHQISFEFVDMKRQKT